MSQYAPAPQYPPPQQPPTGSQPKMEQNQHHAPNAQNPAGFAPPANLPFDPAAAQPPMPPYYPQQGGPPPQPELMSWSVDQVCGFLERIGQAKWVQLFRDNEINGIALSRLDENRMTALGVVMGPALTILHEVDNLKRAPPAPGPYPGHPGYQQPPFYPNQLPPQSQSQQQLQPPPGSARAPSPQLQPHQHQAPPGQAYPQGPAPQAYPGQAPYYPPPQQQQGQAQPPPQQPNQPPPQAQPIYSAPIHYPPPGGDPRGQAGPGGPPSPSPSPASPSPSQGAASAPPDDPTFATAPPLSGSHSQDPPASRQPSQQGFQSHPSQNFQAPPQQQAPPYQAPGQPNQPNQPYPAQYPPQHYPPQPQQSQQFVPPGQPTQPPPTGHPHAPLGQQYPPQANFDPRATQPFVPPVGQPGQDINGVWVELTLACRHLKNMDVGSKTDSFVVVDLEDGRDKWTKLGQTEVVDNNLNPKYAKRFRIQYFFERLQTIRFSLFDFDDHTAHDPMGVCFARLSQLVGTKGRGLMLDFVNNKAKTFGQLVVSAEEVSPDPEILMKQRAQFWADNMGEDLDQLEAAAAALPPLIYAAEDFAHLFCSASHLDKKDTFGKSDPYYKIYRQRGDGAENQLFYESSVLKKTLDPTWPEAVISMREIVKKQGDFNIPLLVEVYDWDRMTAHDLIGTCQFSMADILNQKNKAFELINPDLQRKKKNYKNSGLFHIIGCQLEQRQKQIPNPDREALDRKIKSLHKKYEGKYRPYYNPSTFLQYLAGGMQINLTVAVDWTGSNGNPDHATSLHHRNPVAITDYYHPDMSQLNEYQQAIVTVGRILADYDYDKRFPIYGFGGSAGSEVSHCFPLSPEGEVSGVEGMLRAYDQAFQKWKLAGPTHFHEVLRTARKAAEGFSQANQYYHILLIMTDGSYNDRAATIKELALASRSVPLSVVIVGVGKDKFEQMEELDADDEPLVEGSHRTVRDLVQFVPFRQFRDNPSALAEHVLKEIPDQVRTFMAMNKVVPNNAYAFSPPPTNPGF